MLREGGGADEVLAAVDIDGQRVERVRWISTKLRPTKQDAIVERLEGAITDEEALEAAADKEPSPDAESSLQPLIRMLERQGHTTLGMDAARAQDITRQEPLRALALALRDLSTDRSTFTRGDRNLAQRPGPVLGRGRAARRQRDRLWIRRRYPQPRLDGHRCQGARRQDRAARR